MTFPSDDDLILYYYGEAERAAEIEAALAASPELAARFEELRRVLDAVDGALPAPERGVEYGAAVWRRLAPRLRQETAGGGRWRRGLGAWRERFRAGGAWWPQPLAPAAGPAAWGRLRGFAAAAAVLLAVGFFLGRLVPPAGEPPQAAGLGAEARDQILLTALAEHFERSERLLVEVANAEPAAPEAPADLAAERRWAGDLLAANRLYRQSALQGGRPRLAAVLDELEPLLLELAHAPDELPAQELATLRERIEERALLFKMRVVVERLDRLERRPQAATEPTGPSIL